MKPAAFRFLSWSTSGQTSSRRVGLITVAVGCAFFGCEAAGQPTSSLPHASTLKKLSLDQLLNIEVISVSKRPEKLADTASAIQVITGDDIRLSGATRLPE